MSDSNLDRLKRRFDDRSALIAIIGLGYVGLPLMLRFIEEGYRVVGIDVDQTKVAALNRGESQIEHIPDTAILAARRNGFEASGDFSRAHAADVLIICVPTPLDRHREPDLGYVIASVESLLPSLRPGQLVSLESTTYPGTTDEELKPRIESTGLRVGEDIFLVFSPEREDPGNRDFCTRTIPKVCGGATVACLAAGMALYGKIIDRVVPVSSTRAAEMTKLLENIHRAVNIGLVNEMKMVSDRMGIDIHEVIDAAATKPFGFVPYYPGPGLGGHCIPIDPFYLTWKAREYGIHTRFIELAGEVNHAMPEWVVGKVVDALNARGKALNGSKILVLGIAYKKNVDDMRESPALAMMDLLHNKGAVLAYSDPYVPVFQKTRGYPFELASVALTPDTIREYDCVLIATHHDRFDWRLLKEHALLIVDSRGVYRERSAKIVKA